MVVVLWEENCLEELFRKKKRMWSQRLICHQDCGAVIDWLSCCDTVRTPFGTCSDLLKFFFFLVNVFVKLMVSDCFDIFDLKPLIYLRILWLITHYMFQMILEQKHKVTGFSWLTLILSKFYLCHLDRKFLTVTVCIRHIVDSFK